MPKPTSMLKGFERSIATIKPTSKRQVIFDKETTGLALVVSPKGKKSFSIVARGPDGKQVWKQIGDAGLMTLAAARQEAAEAVARLSPVFLSPRAGRLGAWRKYWRARHRPVSIKRQLFSW